MLDNLWKINTHSSESFDFHIQENFAFLLKYLLKKNIFYSNIFLTTYNMFIINLYFYIDR